MDSSFTVSFVILAFSLGAVLIMKKDTIPPLIRRITAIIALIMIVFAFFQVVYTFITL